MKLYFGNAVTTATTVMILALLGFIGWSAFHRADIQYWGRRSDILLIFGLVVCCFAAARDGLDKTIQHAVDGSCAPGLFPLVSVPTIVGCIGALLIIVAAIATLIAKTQRAREVWFYLMSGGVVLKIATMEIARTFSETKGKCTYAANEQGRKIYFRRIRDSFRRTGAASATSCGRILHYFGRKGLPVYRKQNYGRLLRDTAGTAPAVEAGTYPGRNANAFVL